MECLKGTCLSIVCNPGRDTTYICPLVVLCEELKGERFKHALIWKDSDLYLKLFQAVQQS